MVRSGCACGCDEGRALGLGAGGSPGRGWGRGRSLPWETTGERGDRADARAAALLQVLLHVLFEHAVGYALLALKEVEEISLLLPQVGKAADSPASSQPLGPPCPSMHRALPRGRPHIRGCTGPESPQSRGSIPAFATRVTLGVFRSKPPGLHPVR